MFYAMLIIVVISLGIGIYAVVSINKIKSAVSPATINLQDFLKKVSAHKELSQYANTAPSNIVQINQNNLESLQSQIQGLNVNHIGKFLIQYPNTIVLYDYSNDKVESTINAPPQPQLPLDFFTKLYTHPELKELEGVTPIGGVLDINSLSSLQQQFPDVYKDAKAGDVLLRYPTALVIYDYSQDKIVNAVPLQQQGTQELNNDLG